MSDAKKILVVEDNDHYFNPMIQLCGKKIILATDYNSACCPYDGILTKRHGEIKLVVTDLCCGNKKNRLNLLRMSDDENEIYKDYCRALFNYYEKTGEHMIYEMLRAGVNREWRGISQRNNQEEWENEMNFSLYKGAHPIESRVARWIFDDRMGWPFGYKIAKRAEELGIPVAIITTGGHHGCQWIPLLYHYLGGNNEEYLKKLISIYVESEKVVGKEYNGKFGIVENILITHCYEKTPTMWKKAMKIAK